MSALVKTQPKLPALVYVKAAVNPATAALVTALAVIGLGFAGLTGVLTALVVCGSAGYAASRFASVRGLLETRALQASREKLLLGRLKIMERGECGQVRQQHLRDLSSAVNEIEDTDPALAERFELQALLDHFVAVAVNYSKALDAFQRTAERGWCTSSVKSAIRERRVSQRDRCSALVTKLDNRLEEIDELIRLVSQRAAYAKVDVEHDNEIERRLNELDEVEAAFNQLSEQA